MLLRSALCVVAIVGCARGDASDTAHARAAPSSGAVDSILPLDEALRRFRHGLPRVTALSGGAGSRDELVRQFARAIAENDTAAIRALVLTRSEYAWLYYPGSTFAREPYYQMPQLNWFLNVQDSEKGITRVMTRFGGTGLAIRGYSCPDAAQLDGGLRFWHGCSVRFSGEGSDREARLFGSIVERDGRFKFYSYANDL